MEYQLYEPKVIHLDPPEIEYIDLSPEAAVQCIVAADVFKAFENKLPIIVEDQFRIIDGGKALVTCMVHTKVILKFVFEENPINDLVKMFDAVFQNAQWKFNQYLFKSPLNGFKIKAEETEQEVRFNKAYQLKEAARTQQLLA